MNPKNIPFLTIMALASGLVAGCASLGFRLHQAVHENQKDEVLSLIEKGADVNFRSEKNEPPLHIAARQGKLDLVKILVEKGADVNALDGDGNTPLHEAAFLSQLKVMEFLLEHGADPYVKNKSDKTAAERMNPHSYVIGNNLEGIKIYLKLNGDPNYIDAKPDFELSLLGWAVYKNHPEMARLLIEGGADVNLADKRKHECLPITIAAAHNRVEIARLLLEKGANVNGREDDGTGALHLTAGLGKANEEPEHKGKGLVEMAKLLIENGADVNLTNKYGNTPLHTAAEKGAVDVAALLLEKGADKGIKNAGGKPPLEIAVEKKQEKLIAIFEGGKYQPSAYGGPCDDIFKEYDVFLKNHPGLGQEEITRKLVEGWTKTGDCWLQAGNYYRAIEDNYFMAMAFIYKYKDQLLRPRSPWWNTLGDLSAKAGKAYSSWGREEKALESFQSAMEAFTDTNNAEKICRVSVEIANSLSKLGRFQDAMGAYRKTMEFAQRLNLSDLIPKIQEGMAKTSKMIK